MFDSTVKDLSRQMENAASQEFLKLTSRIDLPSFKEPVEWPTQFVRPQNSDYASLMERMRYQEGVPPFTLKPDPRPNIEQPWMKSNLSAREFDAHMKDRFSYHVDDSHVIGQRKAAIAERPSQIGRNEPSNRVVESREPTSVDSIAAKERLNAVDNAMIYALLGKEAINLFGRLVHSEIPKQLLYPDIAFLKGVDPDFSPTNNLEMLEEMDRMVDLYDHDPTLEVSQEYHVKPSNRLSLKGSTNELLSLRGDWDGKQFARMTTEGRGERYSLLTQNVGNLYNENEFKGY